MGGFTKMEYKVIVTGNGEQIMFIDLLCGSAGTNGGLVASMWGNGNDTPNDVNESGNLVNADMQDMECEGVQINTIAGLYQAIRKGSIYMNIFSETYREWTDGAARGQIFL